MYLKFNDKIFNDFIRNVNSVLIQLEIHLTCWNWTTETEEVQILIYNQTNVA